MKNIFSVLLISCITFLASLSCFADGSGNISLAKAAELSAHRIDRLVTLGKIDAGFLNRLEKIEVSKVENSDPIFYRALVSQTQPAQGNPFQVEILFDRDGKPLSFKAFDGGTAGNDLQWTEKDSISLAENSLHYVLENETDPLVAPYFNNLTSVILKKGSLDGQAVATGILTASNQTQKLQVNLKLDGTFISAQAVP